MISAKELLEKGNCVGINCNDCPIKGIGCYNSPFNVKAIRRLKELAGLHPKERTTTLRERLEEYEKAHRALWQECKDDINAMFEDSGD